MTSIFLSYAHEDEARVRAIKLGLGNRGHRVFWDEDIPLGDNWRTTLRDNVLKAQCVLVAWTPASTKSEYVRLECEVGSQHSRLLPVLLESVRPPAQFEHLQAADLRAWYGNVCDPNWERVLALVEECGSQSVVPPVEKVAAFDRDPPVTAGEDEAVGSGPERSERSNLQNLVEMQIRTALDFAPVQRDALRDITSIRVRSDEEFAHEVGKLREHGYEIAQSKPGEARLERKRRFNFVVAAMLTLLFVFPGVIYILIYPFRPKVHVVYVVRVE